MGQAALLEEGHVTRIAGPEAAKKANMLLSLFGQKRIPEVSFEQQLEAARQAWLAKSSHNRMRYIVSESARRCNIFDAPVEEESVSLAVDYKINEELPPTVLAERISTRLMEEVFDQLTKRYSEMTAEQQEQAERLFKRKLSELKPEHRQALQDALRTDDLSAQTLRGLLLRCSAQDEVRQIGPELM